MGTDRVVIVGGGPGGYEAAHVAAQLGAEVTVVDSDGVGGSAVLTDCVPSKTLIATAEVMSELSGAAELGVSESRVSQIRAEALVLLRGAMERALDPELVVETATGTGCVARRREAYYSAVASRHAAGLPRAARPVALDATA